MILVCGGLADGVTELVCSRLAHRGTPYRLLDLGQYPDGFKVHWHWDGEDPSGWLRAAGWHLDLTDVSAVFLRTIGVEAHAPLPWAQAGQENAILSECQAGIGTLLEQLPCLVVNRVSSSTSNHSKPYQSLLIQKHGLQTPRTLVTSDPAEALAFYEECHGEIIYKSISGIRSIVRRMGPKELQRLPLLRHGPVQFQAYIPGDDIRVHVVGDELFATRICSSAIDYRYAKREGINVEMSATKIPLAVEMACRSLAAALRLPLAGIDLRKSTSGEFVCFEVNPAPGFSFYEQHTGQPISEALASLLAAEPRKGERA